MKHLKLIVFTLLFVLPVCLVKADPFYTNNNGVEFDEDEYDYITELYFDGYQADMTQDELNFALENFGERVEKYQLVNNQLIEFDPNACYPDATYYINTTGKDLTLTTSCGAATCTMVTDLDWNQQPSVRSYDLIGIYTSGSYTLSTTKVYKNGAQHASYASSSAQTFIRGFGQSVKLPTGGFSSLEIIQTFSVPINKTLHVSYQHAIQSITLNKSKQYTISSGGLGGVFNHTYSTYYDDMMGISITS